MLVELMLIISLLCICGRSQPTGLKNASATNLALAFNYAMIRSLRKLEEEYLSLGWGDLEVSLNIRKASFLIFPCPPPP